MQLKKILAVGLITLGSVVSAQVARQPFLFPAQPPAGGPFGGHATLTDGLGSAWKLEDTSDSHGSSTLTNINTVTFVAKGGGAPANMPSTVANFVTASNQKLTLTTLGLSGDSSFAISCWALINNAGAGYEGLFGNYNSNNGIAIQRDAANASLKGLAGNATTTNFTGTQAITYGQWHHHILQYDKDTDLLYYYLDLSVQSVSHTGGVGSDGAFSIGGGVGPLGYIDAKISSCYFWPSRFLISDERTDLNASGAGLFY